MSDRLLRLAFLIGSVGHDDIADELNFEQVTDVYPTNDQLNELMLDPDNMKL